jgi:hypothetical protein
MKQGHSCRGRADDIEPLLHALPDVLIHNPEGRNLGRDALSLVTRASDAFSGVGIASVDLLIPQQATHIEVISQDTRLARRMPPDRRIAPMLAVRSLDVSRLRSRAIARGDLPVANSAKMRRTMAASGSTISRSRRITFPSSATLVRNAIAVGPGLRLTFRDALGPRCLYVF